MFPKKMFFWPVLYMKMLKKIALLILFGLFSTASFAQKGEKILIAAASDLKFAVDSIISVYKAVDSRTVTVTYGSSGKLFEQISNGAPFDLYFSADIIYPNLLKEKGLSASDVYPYGVGRIVLWSRKMNPNTAGMRTLLSPSIRKVAIANPAHAPYGKRAKEAMIHFQVQDAVDGKLVLGENISQTAQFVTTGAADVGIVALSLAMSPTMRKQGGKYYLIPESSHAPLLQGAIITRKGAGNELARSFFDFVKGSEAQAILSYFGFSKPE
jgi:molybdate transport system substrate-binding protein